MDIPFCEKNEIKSKYFIKNFLHFKSGKYYISLNWITKKVMKFISVEKHCPACEINYGLCSCEENFIGKAKYNMAIRWGKHNNPTNDSKPTKHLNKNIQHSYNWTILPNASEHTKTRKT